MIDLLKATKKTVIDNADLQYLGNKKQILKMIEKACEGRNDPHFLIMRQPEENEIALYSFEGKLSELKMPDPIFMRGEDD